MKRERSPIDYRRTISLVLATAICTVNSAACLGQDTSGRCKDSSAVKHIARLPVFAGDRVRLLLKSDLQLSMQSSSGSKYEFDTRRPSAVNKLRGVVKQSTRETLVISNRELNEDPISISISSIELLEVRREHRSYVLPGLLIGIVLGAIWAGSYEQPPPQGFLDFDIDLTPVAYFLVPVLVGGIVGKGLSGETWERLPLDHPETSISRLRGGPSVAVSMQF